MSKNKIFFRKRLQRLLSEVIIQMKISEKVEVDMKTVKELITEFKALAERYGSDLQFNCQFEDGTCEFGEAWDFIEKFNFYRSLH